MTMHGSAFPIGTSRRGQILVIVGLAMVALIAAVGVVIDLGFVWAANRDTQNGSDAAAHAGAIVLVQRMAGTSPAMTDAEVDQLVEDAIFEVADANGLTLDGAEYTDWRGNTLGTQVGDGSIPATAQGVRTLGSRIHQTLLATVVGIDEIRVTAVAIAVSGPQADPCPSSEGCALLPVAFPTTIVTCDGQDKARSTRDPWLQDTLYTVPLCGTNPGSLGWIDWTGAGGPDTLMADICTPDPPEIDLPAWFWVADTGVPDTAGVQECLDSWAGRIILVPMFDDRCQNLPAADDACTQLPTGTDGWYHVPAYAAFLLDSAHVINDNPACGSGGNGATRCLIGTFIDAMSAGQVASLDDLAERSPSTMFAIQLIR